MKREATQWRGILQHTQLALERDPDIARVPPNQQEADRTVWGKNGTLEKYSCPLFCPGILCILSSRMHTALLLISSKLHSGNSYSQHPAKC